MLFRKTIFALARAGAAPATFANSGATRVGGEAGYISPQHSYAFQGCKLVHTDRIAHNTPKPSLAMAATERRLFQQQYVN